MTDLTKKLCQTQKILLVILTCTVPTLGLTKVKTKFHTKLTLPIIISNLLLEGHFHSCLFHINITGEGLKAKEMAEKIRVLCWVMTAPENHDKKAKHVKATWGKRCNILLFMSTAEGKCQLIT